MTKPLATYNYSVNITSRLEPKKGMFAWLYRRANKLGSSQWQNVQSISKGGLPLRNALQRDYEGAKKQENRE